MRFTIVSIISALATQALSLPSPVGAADNTLSKPYADGRCGVHIIQFKKHQGPGVDTSVHRLTIILKDAIGDIIGGVSEAPVPAFGEVNVEDSDLPAVFTATVAASDKDSIGFSYNGYSFNSGSNECSFGGYDDGDREGDCTFDC